MKDGETSVAEADFPTVAGWLSVGGQDGRGQRSWRGGGPVWRGSERVAGDGRRRWKVQSQPVSTSGFPAATSADDRMVTAERCAAQLLCGDRAGSPEEVARRLLAIQAQDPRGPRLAVRARSAGSSASDVDSALARRSMVVTWLNRGTLHLVRAEDYWWLHPLTTPQLRTGNSRRLAQEGVPPQDAERAVAAVRAALAADGPLTRSQLRERVAAAGVRTEGQALVHILALARSAA